MSALTMPTKEDLENSSRIYKNTATLLQKGTFAGEVSEAVHEAIRFQLTMAGKIDKTLEGMNEQASPEPAKVTHKPGTGANRARGRKKGKQLRAEATHA